MENISEKSMFVKETQTKSKLCWPMGLGVDKWGLTLLLQELDNHCFCSLLQRLSVTHSSSLPLQAWGGSARRQVCTLKCVLPNGCPRIHMSCPHFVRENVGIVGIWQSSSGAWDW